MRQWLIQPTTPCWSVGPASAGSLTSRSGSATASEPPTGWTGAATLGIEAAVLTGIDQPLVLRDDVEVEPPHAGEVRVRVAACGICRSDLSMQDGTTPVPMPVVLGHEASAVGEEVGEGVTDL